MYFDPGTGSMIIQMLLGAIPVIAAFFVGLRKKIFKKNRDMTAEKNTDNKTEAKMNDDFEDIDDD